MTSIRESVRRLLEREGLLRPDPSTYSYLVHWTNLARGWTAERRESVRRAVEETAGQPGFEPDEVRRLYSVPSLDSRGHSGESLMALREVLRAIAEEGVGRNG